MNAEIKKDAVMQRNKMKRAKHHRVLCLVASMSIFVGTASIITYAHQESVRQLTNQVNSLSSQVTNLTAKNQALSTALQDSYDKLNLFVDTHTVRAAGHEIYHIPLSADLQNYTYNRCVEYGIKEYYTLVLAVMWQESDYSPDMVSSTNDYGIMQINKVNQGWLSKLLGTTNYLDARQNIRAGTYLISKLLLKYDDVDKALMAYNMGESAAAECWSESTYTSSYSRHVEIKRGAIESDNYTAD